MSEIEFINREAAEAEAARAIGLLNASDADRVEAWFALQAVANQVGEAGNLGIRGIWWEAPRGGRRRGRYWLQARCIDGPIRTSTGAPATLEAAREPAQLAKARALLDRLVREKGGYTAASSKRPKGTGDALVRAVSASEEGAHWVEERREARGLLLDMVNVADAYGRQGVYPPACIRAHQCFIEFDDRAELVRRYPTAHAAGAKAMALRGRAVDIPTVRRVRVCGWQATKLAARTGVTAHEARVILSAVLDGRSKAKLVRAVNEAIKMVEADGQRLKVAA